MSEQKVVRCRCGEIMHPDMVDDEQWRPSYLDPDSGGNPGYRYVCECGWCSPLKKTREAAYIAATATPPNLPLTREQVEAMDDDAAVYFVHGVDLAFAYGIDCDSAKIAKDLINRTPSYYAGHKGYFFDAAKGKPTPADIAAARKGE